MPRRLFVGNLPWSVSSEELASLFAVFGKIEFAEVKYKDPEKRQSRGIGFVQLETEEQAETAIAALNSTEIGGRAIVVNYALPRVPRTDNQSTGYRQHGGNQQTPQDRVVEPSLNLLEDTAPGIVVDPQEQAA